MYACLYFEIFIDIYIRQVFFIFENSRKFYLCGYLKTEKYEIMVNQIDSLFSCMIPLEQMAFFLLRAMSR